ncbi:MAG TPA: LysM domain-containing protein [Opitutaceae bacterium]|nr:LysM domain-containing protein [Opitutaceae bacterium]
MDTISRDSNTSYLPVAGVLVGVLALIVGAAGLFKANSVGKKVPDNLPDQLATLETNVSAAAASADKAGKDIVTLKNSVQSAFDSIGPEIGNMKASIANLEAAAKARAAAPKAGKGEAAVAGPGEYVVKPGDTGMKISKATGVSLQSLEAANPGVNWSKLRIGQVIKTK